MALIQGNYRVSLHARNRMVERMISDGDIRECGSTTIHVKPQINGTYKLKGLDLDGNDLSVVCAWDGETIVITLF